jgi:protoheme IX farnesyltransferase
MSFASEIRGTHVASHASFARAFGRSRDFIALTKPRVMSLAVFTALVGLMLAPEHPNPLTGLVAILCIAAGAGAAGALNMWYEADIDAVMARTALRPIPRGRLSRGEALCFGLVLAAGAILILALATNVAAAALLAATILFYVVVYTMWLKRRTPQNIVIGGAAGACPPLIGWLAAGGPLALEPLLLTLIIFLWTPPHFWALSLNRAGEYTRAGVPMLPVVAGKAATKRQILIYCFLLVAAAALPWAFGAAGTVYAVISGLSGAAMIALAIRLDRSLYLDARPARRLFAFSILYLFILFAALLVDAAVITR